MFPFSLLMPFCHSPLILVFSQGKSKVIIDNNFTFLSFSLNSLIYKQSRSDYLSDFRRTLKITLHPFLFEFLSGPHSISSVFSSLSQIVVALYTTAPSEPPPCVWVCVSSTEQRSVVSLSPLCRQFFHHLSCRFSWSLPS